MKNMVIINGDISNNKSSLLSVMTRFRPLPDAFFLQPKCFRCIQLTFRQAEIGFSRMRLAFRHLVTDFRVTQLRFRRYWVCFHVAGVDLGSYQFLYCEYFLYWPGQH